MPKINWQIFRGSDDLELTDYVQNIVVTWGRQTLVSPYQGRIATITIRNNNEQADYFEVNEAIYIYETFSTPINAQYLFYGVVLNREFLDQGGNGKGSTCVITCVDGFYLAGTTITNKTLTDAVGTLEELATKVTNPNAFPSGSWNFVGTTEASFEIGAFSGNIQSQMQQTILADRGIVLFKAYDETEYVSPGNFQNIGVSGYDFGRLADEFTLGYETLERSEAASEGTWFNNATITGALTTATKSNGSSAEYGVKSFTTTSTQENFVNSSAEWWANNFISPNRINVTLSFVDIAQDTDALESFLSNQAFGGVFYNVIFTPPGGSSEQLTFWPEFYTVSASPEMTRVTLKMSNFNSYNNFILDDSKFGVLDSSRLGVGEII